LIGSIFIAVGFTLLGLSFQEGVSKNPYYVSALVIMSIFLMSIWGAYNLIIQRYIKINYQRLWKIEEEIKKLNLDITLHTTMNEKIKAGKGQMLFWITIAGFLIFCLIRFHILFANV
jgi:hypothetical protein